MTVDFQNSLLAIQKQCFTERIELRQKLQDFDGLRKHVIRKDDFVRTMQSLRLKVHTEELQALADKYEDQSDCEKCCYHQFCADVESVAVIPNLETQPLRKVPPPGSSLVQAFQVHKCDNEEDELEMQNLLFSVAQVLRAKGTNIKDAYKDYDKANCGVVTQANFLRAFPVDASMKHRCFLANRYAVKGMDGRVDVNYRALNQDVSEAPGADNDGKQQGSGADPDQVVEDPDQVEIKWDWDDLSTEQILQAYAYERSLRMRDYFQDYDPLRKGNCCWDKVRAVFSLLGISQGLNLSDDDLNALVQKYTQPDGKFNWASMCDILDDESIRAFVPGDEGGGQLRNHMETTKDEDDVVIAIEKRINARTQKNSINLLYVFADFDKNNRKRVTATQFHRALSSMGYEINAVEVGLLVTKYCDNGEKDMINYLDCLNACAQHPIQKRGTAGK